MTAVLGISAFYHDSAATLVVNGQIIAAAQEERFSRVKNDRRFPVAAIEYCLREANVAAADVDFVAFYEKPLLKFDRVLETHAAYAPRGFRSFCRTMPSWLQEKLHVPRALQQALPGFKNRFLFADHHESHAASAFFPSPFKEAAILTVDGVGEWATAAFGVGHGNSIQLTQELRFPHSLGLLYSAFTYYCGFEVDSGEYKLMGLAPYGEPQYVDLITERIVSVKPDGSMWMEMSYFDYCHGLRMTSRKFHRIFGGPPRRPDSPLEQRHLDIAASIQQVTEEILLRAVRHVHEQTGLQKLCMAGGVALNCVANGRLFRESPFDEIWIQPAAGDAGGALGAALLVWFQLLKNSRTVKSSDAQHGSQLGPGFDADQIRKCLVDDGAEFEEYPDTTSLCVHMAKLLADQKVVGWFQGRMEFGPRALGNRSILADARNAQMQQLLNQKIKFRESFRPFAPAVLAEHTGDYFDAANGDFSPYMLLVSDVCASKRRFAPADIEPWGLEKLSVIRSEIPAATHVDGTSRIQTVDDQRFAVFAALLREFYRQTGCPLLVNTSFNVRDEPIVCTPEDAYRCFLTTDTDVLVLGQFVLQRENVPASARQCASKRPDVSWDTEAALLAGSPLVDVDSGDARPRQLRVFGAGLIVLAGLLVVVGVLSTVWQPLLHTLAAATGIAAVTYWSFPVMRRIIFSGLMRISFPFSWTISLVAMAVVWYLVVTPTALVSRLFRRDVLRLRPDGTVPTYWRERRLTVNREQYLRQF